MHLRRLRRLSTLFSLALLTLPLTGCLGTDEGPREDGTEARRTLTILTHDSYYIGEDVIAEFERAHDADVKQVARGDAGEILNVAILTKDRPIADLLFGVDNTLLARAKAESVFEPYTPENASKIREDLVFDPDWHVTPVDYGYVNVNYDKAALEKAGLEPPTSLRELTEPEWKGKLVVMNPATSSPGLAFLLATVATFGESGDHSYQDFWRDLEANDAKVAQGWSDAYFTHFAGGGYGGEHPLVVSYTTSPPYAVREACTENDEYLGLDGCPKDRQMMPTANADIPGGAWRQIEAMGVLKNAPNADLAKAFIEFALTKEYQESAAFHMFVYPATTDATPPDFFGLVTEPTEFATIPASDVTPENVKAWTDGWNDAVIG